MSNDRTEIIGDATKAYVLDPEMAQADEKCPACGANIPSGDQFCPSCGYQRGTWGGGSPKAEQGEPVAAMYYLVSGDVRYPLVAGENIAGRGDVAVQVNDGYISRQHAKFVVADEAITLEDLGSSNGTFIDGSQLAPNEPASLIPGATVKLGQTEFQLEKSAGEESAVVASVEETGGEMQEEPIAQAEEAQVDAAVEGPGDAEETEADSDKERSNWILRAADGTECTLTIGETIAGRKAAGCDIAFPEDGFVSGTHCKFTAGESLTVTDLGSTNGTFVNGEQVDAEAPRELAAGDIVKIGQTELTVSMVGVELSESEIEPEPGAETDSPEGENLDPD